MSILIKQRFIKKYWFSIEKTDSDYVVFNTQRGRQLWVRDGTGYPMEYFNSLEEAMKFLDELEAMNYDM